MAIAKQQQAASTRELKHRVLTCLNKLSDRDTHSAAAMELESIARTLPRDSIPPFLSSISATDASDKSPVRKQCVRLISLLSESHGDALSPFLSKLLSAVVRRLRDPDSAVRSACINATASISSHITKPSFTSIVKPLIDALVTEQDQNSQIGAALCLAAAIDASPDPEPLYLKKLLPRLEKLLKSDSFKAKPALLTLIGSVIGAGAASAPQTLKNLVPCLVEFIGSEDWAARKAAAEALVKLSAVERVMLLEFKTGCLKIFEAKKFDKVKIVRETMNQLVESWKEIPDVSDETSRPSEPQSSSKEEASDGRYPPGFKTSFTITPQALQLKKKNIKANGSYLPDVSVVTTAQKGNHLDITSDKKSSSAIFRKLDRQKPNDRKFEIANAREPYSTLVCEDDSRSRDADDKMVKFAGSGVVPCHVESSGSAFVVSNVAVDMHRMQKECEDLSLIREQLDNIKNQQSSLLDLLQKFMGSSQNGMHSLERRVQGLELALDEISNDLAVSSGRLSNIESEGTSCCLSPKFWRRTEARHSTSRLSFSGGAPPLAALRNIASKDGDGETFKLEKRRFQMQGSGGFIVNPLAEVLSDSHGISEFSSNRVSRSVGDDLRHVFST